MERIQLGDEVKDTVTSYQGIAIAITEWLNGCRRIIVQPRTLGKDGEMPKSEQVDENQLVIVAKGVVVGQNVPPVALVREPMPARSGGPREDAVQHATPTRQ